ncbi:MAG: CHAD domain-containing protein [Deltaproteobacteria bacterium]|nr:CHAD domain-containing protein [Deltaproteobacteria bacterium]
MPTKKARVAADSSAILKRCRSMLLAGWEDLRATRRAVLKTFDPDDIHDLRVASRRFRALVKLFEPWMPSKNAASMNKKVRKLTRTLGVLRNIDEAQLFFRRHSSTDSGPESLLCRDLPEMRGDEMKRVAKTLALFDQNGLERVVQKLAVSLEKERSADGDSISLPGYFSNISISLFQAIHALLPAAAFREARETRHSLRIAIKKWRYFLEIAGPALDFDCSSILGLLREYQSILGGMNDVAEFGRLCEKLTLSQHERGIVENILRAEDEILLEKFEELIRQKPLTYYFVA